MKDQSILPYHCRKNLWQRAVSFCYFLGMFPTVILYMASFSWSQSSTRNRHNDLAGKEDLDFPLDPNTCWLYMSVLPQIAVLLFTLRGIRRTIRVLGTFWWMTLIMFRYFQKLPSTYPRSEVRASDPVTQFFWEWLHCVDEPNCTMPSGHVALCTYLGLLMYEREKDEEGEKYLRWAVLIGASTLTTKQHYVMDVLGGFLVASQAYRRLDDPKAVSSRDVEEMLDDIVHRYDDIISGRVPVQKEDLHPGLQDVLQRSLSMTENDAQFLYPVLSFKYAFFRRARTHEGMTPRRASRINMRYTISLVTWLIRGGTYQDSSSLDFHVLTPALVQGLSLINRCLGMHSSVEAPKKQALQ